MKVIFRRIMLVGCGMLFAILLILYILLPSRPASWARVKVGMTSEQVRKIDPEFKKEGWKDVKGFDGMTVTKGKSYWQILIYYDGDVVTSVEKRLYHGGLGCFIYQHTTE